jgi:NADH-quinone oxidoreductase subunit M
MGYVLIGLAGWKINEAGDTVTLNHWQMGISGAMFQMIAPGISSVGMFFMVGVIYARVHHRNLNEFGGLIQKMPVYSGLAVVIFFAGLGLPGMCGFIGEVFVVLSSWSFSPFLAVIAASGVILTAGYILWTIQRVYFGPEYKGPHADEITPMNDREKTIGYSLAVLAIVFGVFPYQTLLGMMEQSTAKLTTDMSSGYKRTLERQDEEFAAETVMIAE